MVRHEERSEERDERGDEIKGLKKSMDELDAAAEALKNLGN